MQPVGKPLKMDSSQRVISMVAVRTTITRELDNLIYQQIHTLKQDAKISERDKDRSEFESFAGP